MESQVSLNSVVFVHPEDDSPQDGDLPVKTSTPDRVESQQPAKKTTRQWAAWTRQEEESFFTALRQVGKNFEKITRRVQSKNKDQVRHYYYRLVRRMNKLLGPGLCLDAKNSKDTNAAMLRWWSLLEKYSCKASKLHLKPRRFKIFLEALENQLLKDRKKNVRKRPMQGENSSPTAPSTVTNQNRDNRTMKLVLVDSQNIQKFGPAKGPLKRNVNIGIIRTNNKGDSTAMKPPRQRRKQGVVSSATYKKWEKAAIAGVSLVADAAEHLERTATDKEVEHDQGEKEHDPVEKVMPSLPALQNHYVENNALNNLKLKLQLFPIDDGTRKSLEMEKHNPHLELTLSTRKKISSVLEHLNRKWGNSVVASGKLMLFPYGVQRESLAGYQRWTQDSIVSAADVHMSIGCPSVFRLRYGWFCDSELASATLPAPLASNGIPEGDCLEGESGKRDIVDPVSTRRPSADDHFEQLVDTCKDQLIEVDKIHAPAPTSSVISDDISGYIAVRPRNIVESPDPPTNISWHRKDVGESNNMEQLEDADELRLSNGTALSAGEWADSLTNISVGDLLSDVHHDVNSNCTEPPIVPSDQCLQQIPFSCDSFDAAIAAHMSKHQNNIGYPSAVASNTSSIWDAEETCDAFSFQKNHVLLGEVPASSGFTSLGADKQIARTSLLAADPFMKDLSVLDRQVDYAANEDPMDECESDPQDEVNSAKDFTGLTDIYWPDSLGPLDLDIPSSKYHSEDLILCDSLSGLNRLIASSLDAFQNCSFFGLDKKDLPSTVEARETASFSDFKVGGGV